MPPRRSRVTKETWPAYPQKVQAVPITAHIMRISMCS